jgi:aspartate-semialdehyde dehydrogenase
MNQGHSIGIVGATGAVGKELLQILDQRRFPVKEIRAFASSRSAGSEVEFQNEMITVELLQSERLAGLEIVFFSAGATRSKEWAPIAVGGGSLVIDNSSAFRMDENVPLVIPEINWHSVQPENRLLAVPNCTAIVLLMAISPLRSLGKISRVIVSTYQSASGAGATAMEELRSQTLSVLDGESPKPVVFPHPYAFNLFSHNTVINELGQNEEEAKVVQESKKILEMPDLKLNVTCVRVPVLRAHSESITVEFEGLGPSESSVREMLSIAPGVRVVDDRANNHFPMPLEASGTDEVLVGRIRKDLSNENAICLFACGDQLRKGAALNAVQIAEKWFGI